MARPKRKPQLSQHVPRTIERIAIAALAAIAARGSGESLAIHAVAIFVVVVIVEELGRRWVWHGKKVTLRDVALGSVGELRLRWTLPRSGRKRRRRRPAARSRRSVKTVAEVHKEGRRI